MDLNFLHFDLDAFFASCEILDSPKLKHAPMVVGSGDQRGIITTANYEARKYGLHPAISIFQAKKIVPNLVIIAPGLGKYRRNNEKALGVLPSFSNKIQKTSVDGGCMDISHIKMDRLELANLIQENVKIKAGLSISIGISHSMSLAKFVSDWNKPHGIEIIAQDDIPNILLDLEISKIQGTGRKSEEKLSKTGIRKAGNLYDLSRNNLRELSSKFGEVTYDGTRGIDERQLDLPRVRKSIEVEYTFKRDLKNYNELLKKAGELNEELSDDFRKKSIKTEVIRIKIELNDFSVTIKSMALEEYISDFSDIFRVVRYLVVSTKIKRSVGLLGITAANLSDTIFGQLRFL